MRSHITCADLTTSRRSEAIEHPWCRTGAMQPWGKAGTDVGTAAATAHRAGHDALG